MSPPGAPSVRSNQENLKNKKHQGPSGSKNVFPLWLEVTGAGHLAWSIFLALGQVGRSRGAGIRYPLRPEAVSKALEQVISPFLDYLPGAYYVPGTVLGDQARHPPPPTPELTGSVFANYFYTA